MRHFLILTFLTAILGCSGPTQKLDECHYEIVETYAKVIDLKPHPSNEGEIAVVLSFEGSSLALEDQELSELKDVTINHDFLVRNNVNIGLRYKVTVSEITSGNCTPIFVSFETDLN